MAARQAIPADPRHPPVSESPVMKKVLRFLRLFLLGVIAVVAVCAALLAYFVYSPEPAAPQLSGALSKGSIEVGGLKRSYVSYVPRGLPKNAPLLLVMHGSGESANQIRVETGYEFERLADQHGFAVVYPNSHSFDWNDCGKVGEHTANGREVDDVAFLGALVDQQVVAVGVDAKRVFATGVSAGGFMALRLALETPAKFRAVAAVAANVQVADNFKCQPTGQAIPVMIMTGTKDPLVPFDGGEVNLLGLFYKSGYVRSSRDSAQYFTERNGLAGAPHTQMGTTADGVGVEQLLWRADGKPEVEMIAIHGGGHGLPQAYYRRPRLLGPSPMTPDGPAMIWAFFARQQP